MSSTVAVRRGTFHDVPYFVELGMGFYNMEGARTADPQQLARFALSHLRDDAVFFAVGQPLRAVLCGVVQPHYLTGERAAFKTVWYATAEARGHGAKLLLAFERWAVDKGAKRVFVAGRDPRTLSLLTLQGYSPLETVYTKDLPWQKQLFPSS